MLPVIFGLSGPRLTADEAAFFKDANPAGYILFARNIDDPEQLRALTDSLRDLAGRDDLPILIDQEGGRIARLGPPHWRAWPACARPLAPPQRAQKAERRCHVSSPCAYSASAASAPRSRADASRVSAYSAPDSGGASSAGTSTANTGVDTSA